MKTTTGSLHQPGQPEGGWPWPLALAEPGAASVGSVSPGLSPAASLVFTDLMGSSLSLIVDGDPNAGKSYEGEEGGYK